MKLEIARIQKPIPITYGMPRPANPVVTRTIIKRSVRSANPPLHSIPSDSERALIYEIKNPNTAVRSINGTSGFLVSIKNHRIDPRITASVSRSKVESRSAPQAFEPFSDRRAIVPSSKSNRTKKTINNVPKKKCPCVKVKTAANIVNSAPMAVTRFAPTPNLISPRQIGVINLVTGARNDSCNIFPIVGFVVVSIQIFPPIAPKLRVSVVGKSGVEIANYLGLTPVSIEDSDAAIFIVSAIDGISTSDIELWNLARQLYIPSLILITELSNGDTDFDDMSAIAGRMLDPVQTPYLVLHDDNGNPTALINLDTLKLSDYSNGGRSERESDPEHKVLVFEFRKEYLEAIEEFGESGFQDGLSFPALPFIPSNGLGSYEIASLLNKLPSRS